MITRRWSFGLLAALLAFALAPAALAQTAHYKATLAPASGSAAHGQAEFDFDRLGNQLTYTIVYDGLSGPAVSGHIHGLGQAIVYNLPRPDAPVTGTTTLSPADAAALAGGQLSIDIHTSAFPNGEVSGPILPR